MHKATSNTNLASYRPQYETVAERIIDYILEAKLKPGDRLPPEQKLGEQLGVGRSVVREAVKYLSATGLIGARRGYGLYVADREELLDRMTYLAESMGLSLAESKYSQIPALTEHQEEAPEHINLSGLGRISRKGVHPVYVNIVVNSLATHYDFAILRGVESACYEHGYYTVLSTVYDESGQERNWMKTIKSGNIDGALLVLSANLNIDFAALHQLNLPIVIVDNCGEMFPEIPSVGATNWTGALQATHYLIRLGHTKIATISGTPNFIAAQARAAGFRVALETAGIAINPQYVRPGFFVGDSGYVQTNELLDLPEPPTAIFVCNDIQSIGVYHALRERGVKIPEEMSVIGFDNDPRSEDLWPQLTTINQPLMEMGRVGTNMMATLLQGKKLDANRVELATSIVIRDSCAAPRSGAIASLGR